MLRGIAVLAAAVVPLLGLAACADELPAEDPAAVEVSHSNGLKTYEVPSAGFSIAVPEAWRSANADELFSDEAVAEARTELPELAPVMELLATPDSPMKLIAFDPDLAGEDFATNLNVVVEQLPAGMKRQRYWDLTLEQLMRALGPDVHIDEKQLELPGGWAMNLSYQGFSLGDQTLSTVQYFFHRPGRGYVLTYTTLPDRLPEAAPDYERSARTFRVG